ncbi:UDP-N-acetylmuramoyl-L-alanyl-D-glutamate--2,6-diaminopimelate ligase [Tissierella pigra]|uniref:UDP-N-acetylmuramoyl-L-alanyl-D-glutamate--2,6-diaminopimelate ligase n=1 Tax=Tissierella pigra TaxID=2607614 RepID=A0A6N7XYJ5_9FIRM|nr:UDP-N-acetylmuramoyl-L-alanyl-D-glutamate--2,6-diaminopimelate ligase [Tissierella pigra]MBU5426798.1 UDP-N-acetylmuramoyl-L-alanyl-D-glutamate--2,6-diaminopimelate ligase [Tissierella pigra]MSU01328.1 UDP-N-acetylmuramoyl-L-alanyl-D-glutamate--2,6-diaminopimelate ligase [Tissierella pigra]
MKLKDIVKDYKMDLIKGNLEVDIKNVRNNSRCVEEGDLFIAEKGFTVDGHDYIQNAIDNGAIAIVTEKEISIKEDITIIKVEDTIDALGKFSGNFFNSPWNDLEIIGITGTNGKTSITYFIKSILEENNNKIGIIGTIGAVIDGENIKLENTTPNSLVIHKLLKDMVNKNTEFSIMEVSSHSLELKRVDNIEFQIGLFTNLTKDHLDYHETMENYFNSKLKLFYKTNKFNIINIDDEYGKKIVQSVGERIPLITYGIKDGADIFATNVEFTLSKVKFTLNTPKGSTDILLNIPGEFSVYNALAAATVAYAYDVPLDIIKKGLEKVQGIKGRFEVVPTNTDYTVIIDFAHTADGLEKVLTVIDEFAEGRKIVVFGAGGNRDKTKRPVMGETVASHADLSIVTSDNPRYEDPEAIIEDVLIGTKKVNGKYVKIVDRIEAIKYAIDNAKPKDIILLAGKGHETYTIIKGETYPCDERQIVLEYLNSKNI